MKKKNSIYLIPIVLLILFGAYYWNFSAGYEAKIEARAAAKQAAHEAKIAEDNRERLKAVNDAIASEAKRKAEREAKAAADLKYQQELEAAKETRDLAIIDEGKLRDKYNSLLKQIREVQEEIKRIDEDKQVQVGELDFLQIDTAKAETNVQNLTAVVTKIVAADAAFAAEAAARAAAATKK